MRNQNCVSYMTLIYDIRTQGKGFSELIQPDSLILYLCILWILFLVKNLLGILTSLSQFSIRSSYIFCMYLFVMNKMYTCWLHAIQIFSFKVNILLFTMTSPCPNRWGERMRKAVRCGFMLAAGFSTREWDFWTDTLTRSRWPLAGRPS